MAAADGRLEDAEARARITGDPALSAALERQQEGLALLASAVGSTSAPLRLRTTVERLERSHAERAEPAPRRGLGRLEVRAWLLAGSALAVVFVALLLAGGAPTVEDAAAVASRGPAAPAPASAGRTLRYANDGVVFPDLAGKFSFAPVGRREDQVDGRRVRTVFYRRAGRTVAYSIVAGDALERPGGTRTERDGVEFVVGQDGGRTVVWWERQGRTCVMVSTDATPVPTLLELAAWKGQGAVPF